MKLSATLLFTIAAEYLVGTTAYLTKEKALSQNVRSSLNYMVNIKFQGPAQMSAAMTGLIRDQPQSSPLVWDDALFYDDGQQYLWAQKDTTRFAGSGIYTGFQTGAFQSYDSKAQNVYQYRPPDSKSTACPASQTNSNPYSSNCRSGWHMCLSGIATNKSIALKSQLYDARVRPWWYTAGNASKPTYANLFTFSSTDATTSGIAFASPWYKNGKLIGIASSDFDSTLISAIIKPYSTPGTSVFLVETSTYYLAASSMGAKALSSTNTFMKACSLSNPIIAGASSVVSSSCTKWAADGDYSATINGLPYAINYQTYNDASSTLSWKIVVVTQRAASGQTSDYVQSLEECFKASIDQVERTMESIMSVASNVAALHGANLYAPLRIPPMKQDGAPLITGTTQQAFWSLTKTYNSNSGGMIGGIYAGYETNSFIGYLNRGNGIQNLYYRAPDSADTSCPAIPGYAAVPSKCGAVYSVNADGTAATANYQASFEPSKRPWYTNAKTTGSTTWSPLYISSIVTTGARSSSQSFTIPMYDASTAKLYGVSSVVLDLKSYSDNLKSVIGSKGYTAYIVQKSTGFLMATSTSADIYNTTTAKFIKAVDSKAQLIAFSYNYLQSNGLLSSCDVTTSYDANTNMRILVRNMKDSTRSNDIDLVYLETFSAPYSSASPTSAVPTAKPSATPSSAVPSSVPTSVPTIVPTVVPSTSAPTRTAAAATSSDNDDKSVVAADAATAAAIFAAFIFIILVVLIVMFFFGMLGGKAATGNRRDDIELSPTSTNAMHKNTLGENA